MTKDVLVTVKGLQSMEDGSPPEEVEMVARGEYYYKNGHHIFFIMKPLKDLQSRTETALKSQKTAWK